MPLGTRIPPGRAGRMWLRRRLGTAERGRDQLDRKLRILLPELQRLRIQAGRLRAQWAAACADASTWLLRATLLGGQDVLRKAEPSAPVEIELTWTTAMGLRYPVDVTIVNPVEELPMPAGNSAIGPATAAFRTALRCGVRAAAADDAVRRVEAEIAVTRRRLRALEKRWLPWLQDALTGLEQSVELAEQEDGMRLRRAAAALADRRPP